VLSTDLLVVYRNFPHTSCIVSICFSVLIPEKLEKSTTLIMNSWMKMDLCTWKLQVQYTDWLNLDIPSKSRSSHQELLSKFRYHLHHPVKRTPGLSKHETRKTTFTLVVDDFRVQYFSKEDADHLTALQL
jgi:hypothetical protein